MYGKGLMKVLSLFDGIACGYEALIRAWIPIEKYRASEIDKYAIQIALKNHPDIVEIGDVNDLDFSKYDADIVMWGSPCQDLSVAKANRQWLNWARSWLFRKFVEAVRTIKPKYFLLENVNSMSKEAKETISNELWVQPILINSALVSAQQRKRLYWTNIPWVTQPKDKWIMLKDILESWEAWCDKSACLTANYPWAYFPHDYLRSQRQMVAEPIRIWQFWKWGQWMRIYSVEWKSVNLNANWWGWGAKTWLYKIDLPDGDYIIRKLSPIECERLQTLPDNYTEWVSKTQRWKMLWNWWTVDVLAHIFRWLLQ